jgi:dTDP-4-dehydrorhamnose 3,5-epimerase
LWSDSALGIEWPIAQGQEPVLAKKDEVALSLSLAEVFA